MCTESLQERERRVFREFYDERESNVLYLMCREPCGMCRESFQERKKSI